jgi:hypothetical protein
MPSVVHVTEAAHLALALARRLMGHFGSGDS